jgi:3-carboxy-cis,cis-muconate cycloisomerase
VAAEALVTLARLNAGTLGTLHQAMLHAEERDGSALGLEWFALPAMAAAAGAATGHARALAGSLAAHPARIAAGFAADRGLMLAEAAVFALAARMPRPEAQALVGEAVKAAERDGATLEEALAARVPDVAWRAILVPARQTGEAAALVNELARAVATGRG